MQDLVYIIFIVLVGVIFWLWRREKNEETRRLYRFIDDMFDRIGSNTIEQYAFTQRIKHEILKQQEAAKSPEAKIEEAIERSKVPPKFVQKG